MLRQLNRLTLCLALFLTSFITHAELVKDFYSASVVVEDRSKKAYEQGVQQILLKVLAKASGSSVEAIEKTPALVFDIKQAPRYILQFTYFNRTVKDELGEEQEQLLLKASFPERTIIDLLQKGGLSLWANDRPRIIVWPIVKRAGELDMLGSEESDEEVLQAFTHFAEEFGLPLYVSTDRAASFKRMWKFDAGYIESVSAKQKAEVVLVTRMALTGDGMALGSVMMLHDGKELLLDINAESLQVFIQDSLVWLNANLAEQYAVPLSQSLSEVVLVVHKVGSYQSYEALLAYLASIDMIEKTYVLEAQGDTLTLALSLKTDLEPLLSALADKNYLLPVEESEPDAYSLYYQWNDQQ